MRQANGHTSTQPPSPAVCLDSHDQLPGDCSSFDQRVQDTGAGFSVCWKSSESESGMASEDQCSPAEECFSAGELETPGYETSNSDTDVIGREADATMVTSPLSTCEGTEMFGEMSIDSGISTLTASMLSQSSGWGLSQSLQAASQSGSQSHSLSVAVAGSVPEKLLAARLRSAPRRKSS